MNWITIYITGKNGFQEEVLDILSNTKLKVMPGSTGGEKDVCLLWIDETVDLKSLKKAIGSKVIFSYRLRFYRELEEIQQENQQTEEFTVDETSRIREMNLWDISNKYKHSA
jgi:hypothetical protein